MWVPGRRKVRPFLRFCSCRRHASCLRRSTAPERILYEWYKKYRCPQGGWPAHRWRYSCSPLRQCSKEFLACFFPFCFEKEDHAGKYLRIPKQKPSKKSMASKKKDEGKKAFFVLLPERFGFRLAPSAPVHHGILQRPLRARFGCYRSDRITEVNFFNTRAL